MEEHGIDRNSREREPLIGMRKVLENMQRKNIEVPIQKKWV